jgi:hypothetical protein
VFLTTSFCTNRVGDVEAYLALNNIPSPKERIKTLFGSQPPDSYSWKRAYGSACDKAFMVQVDENNRVGDSILWREQVSCSYQWNRFKDSDTPAQLLQLAYVAILILCFIFGVNYKGCACVNWKWLGPGIALVLIPVVVLSIWLYIIVSVMSAGPAGNQNSRHRGFFERFVNDAAGDSISIRRSINELEPT